MSGRVLVVEDEEKLRRVIELQLRAAGFEVDQAGSAEEALPLAVNADLIVSDLRLPGMDGLAMLERVKAQPDHPPVIIMTAFGSIEKAVEAMRPAPRIFYRNLSRSIT